MPDDLLLTFGAGAFVLLVLELLKPLWRTAFERRHGPSPSADIAILPARMADERR